jgi:hypothetical protein
MKMKRAELNERRVTPRTRHPPGRWSLNAYQKKDRRPERRMNTNKLNTNERIVLIALASLLIIGAAGYSDAKSAFVVQTAKDFVTKSKRLQMVATIKNGETKSSLILEWAFKNISPRDISFRDTHVLRDYSLIVTDQAGHQIKPTKKGQQVMFSASWASHRTPVTLHPGEKVTRSITISDIYDLKTGQPYSITIERVIGTDNGKTIEKVRSNTVTVKIDR